MVGDHGDPASQKNEWGQTDLQRQASVSSQRERAEEVKGGHGQGRFWFISVPSF
jgi:hypothetical protein